MMRLRIADMSPYVLTTGYLLVFLCVNGALVTSISDLITSFAHPFAPPAPGIVTYDSVLPSLIGHALGIRGATSIILFFTIVVLVTIMTIVWHTVARAATRTEQYVCLLLIALTPLLHTLLSWIGKPDPFLILAYLLFAHGRSALLRNAGIFFMLLTHREAAIVMLAIHFILGMDDIRQWRMYVPGIVLGLAWVRTYTFLLGDPTGRIGFVMQNWQHILQNLRHLPVIAFTGFSWFWVPLLAYLARHRFPLRICVAILVILGVSFLTLDNTRIFVLAGLPLVLYLIPRIAPMVKSMSKQILVGAALLSLLQFEWGGTILMSTHWHMLPWEQMAKWGRTYLTR
jgi:hypothetical protein